MSDRPFSRRSAIVLGLVMSASLVTFLALMVFADPDAGRREAAGEHELGSTWSRSSVGHAAFAALLERLPTAVTVSRFRSGARAGETAVLVLLEPKPGEGDEGTESLEAALAAAHRTLIVMPKRVARRDKQKGWQVALPVSLRDPAFLARRLEKFGVEGRISRPGTLRLDSGALPAPTIDDPQLVVSSDLIPIVAGADGILLGRVRGADHDVYVLSDPDVIQNHGLRRGDNAAFAVGVLEIVGDGALRPVIIDETFHGYLVPPQVFTELLRYPLVVALVHLLLLLGIVYWAGSGRFGAPIREERGVRAGKDVLIGNMAELLLLGRRTPDALRKYFRNAVAAVSNRIGLSKDLTPGEAVERLNRIAAGRGLTVNLSELEAGVRAVCATSKYDEGRVIALARDIHRFRKEFLDGA